MSDCVLLGDKGYLSQTIQLDLFNEVNIELETPKRKIKKTTNHSFISSKNIGKELKHYFLNFATNL
jgi:hypothetical protein